MKRVILFIMLLFPLTVFAKSSFSIDCDKTDKINVNDQIVCRTTINTDFLNNKITFLIEENDAFDIVDIRSNYDKIWDISKDNNKVTVISKEPQNGLQEFGIILLKAKKSGDHTLNFKEITLFNEDDSEVVEDSSIKLKVISTDNLLKEITVNGKPLDNFDKNIFSYTININDEKVVNIDSTANNEFATIKGNGEYKLSDKVFNFIFPIKVVSEDGSSKIYVINLKRNNANKNDINKNLESLMVKNDKGSDLIINFNPAIYEYTFEVGINTNYLELKPVLSNKKLVFVKGYGAQKVTLNPGNNIAIIKVQDETGDILNYVLNIIKPIANKSDNNFLKKIIIEDYNLKFNKRVKNYTLTIKKGTSILNIKPVLESDKARYEIVGNKDLKEGSIIKIIVTAENEEKLTYKINIKIEQPKTLQIIIKIIIIVAILLGLYIFRNSIINYFKKIFNKKKKKSKNSKKKTSKKKTTTNKKTSKKKPTTNKKTRSNYTKKTSSKKKRNNSSKKNTKKKRYS